MPWIDLNVAADEPTEREKRHVYDYALRRAKPRFYADENFPSVAIKILSELGADLLTVRDVRRHGHPDENHAAEALRLGRILITCDRDYLNDRRFDCISCNPVPPRNQEPFLHEAL
jgi:predicted nuclease of predicted toxin-antitoxin system